MNVRNIALAAKSSAQELFALSEQSRVRALEAIAEKITANTSTILAENAKDLKEAKLKNLSSALIDRLTLTEKGLSSLSETCRSIAAQPQVVGIVVEEYSRPNELVIQKQRIPIGVIGMIFESRPNVVVDGAALAIKSGNAIILKGGKEAQYSNLALFRVINEAISGILPPGAVSLIETREDVAELLKLHDLIDLMVPRGGTDLINYVRKNASMPVVAHDKGLCHLYVHKDAEASQVIPIILNAKVQRPGVCNAVESILLHYDYPFNKDIIEALLQAGVEIRGCSRSQQLDSRVKMALEEDYHREYLDKVVSLKIVSHEKEAIEHIKAHGSHHTEAILTQDHTLIERFLNSIDASCLMVNASTRFNDGGELGLGAELGISTSKLHAYGAMGAKEMTTTRFIVKGKGQIR